MSNWENGNWHSDARPDLRQFDNGWGFSGTRTNWEVDGVKFQENCKANSTSTRPSCGDYGGWNDSKEPELNNKREGSNISNGIEHGLVFRMDPANISKHAGGDSEVYKDKTCRNYGVSGHFARECTEPKKLSGECFNCGQVGHNKADCPNPAVPRPFTGSCRICSQEGHRAAECPDKPPVICRNCQTEGHVASECKENRVIDTSGVPEFDSETAWQLIQTASENRDMDDFKLIYCKANKDVTYVDLEQKFREADLNFYVVGLEKEIPNTMTVVSLQGKPDCRYVVGYFFSFKPKTTALARIFPSSAEDNLQRLQDAGTVMESSVPVCWNCKERGHVSNRCPQEKVEFLRPEKYDRCINCLATGHILRDCHEQRVDRSKRCRNCDEPGHIARDCEKTRSTADVECNKCHEPGHFARDCPNSEGTASDGNTCHNCGQAGHFARDCEAPKRSVNVQCRNCDELGHYSRDCPQPRNWSKVKCTNCGEMGHTFRRCPQPADEDKEYGSFKTGQPNVDKENTQFSVLEKGAGDSNTFHNNQQPDESPGRGWGGTAADADAGWNDEAKGESSSSHW